MRLFNALASLILSSDHRRRRATVALMTALAMPLFVGSTGLTVDIGLWFAQKTALQAATDAAAMKAARDLAENAATTTATLQSDAVSAANAASATQFNLNSNDLSIQVVSNPNQTDNRAVEVAAFVQGLGEAIQQSNSTVVESPLGGVTSYNHLNLGQEMGVAAGTAGETAGALIDQAVPHGPTITLAAGVDVGILFLSPLKETPGASP